MRLVVTGGGTGGHIYPALEIAKEMKRMIPGASVLYVGTSTGMERDIVTREGLAFEEIRSSGIMGKSAREAVRGAIRAFEGVGDSFRILRRFRPDVVLGTGGYVSGPVVLSAWMLGIPRAIQEQNAVPGWTNQVLSRIATRTFCAWEHSLRYFPGGQRTLVTGNPVRADLFEVSRREARQHFGIPDHHKVLLVLGGSRGARRIVDAALEVCKRISHDVHVILITGKEYYSRAVGALEAEPENGIEGSRAGNIIIRPYVYNMAFPYNAADLVFCRAGGMTLSEVTALGIASVIVPSPNVAGNHQEYNAQALEQAGAAVVVRETSGGPSAIADAVLSVLGDASLLARMQQASRQLGKPDAARRICRELLHIARGA